MLFRSACKEYIVYDDYPAEEDNPKCRLNGRHLYLELFGIDDVDSEKKRRAQDEQDTRYAQRLLSVAPIEKPYSTDSKRKRNHCNGRYMLAIEDDHQQGGHNGIREKYGRGDAGVHKKEADKKQNSLDQVLRGVGAGLEFFRDVQGKINQLIAKEASEAYLVICGLAQQLK